MKRILLAVALLCGCHPDHPARRAVDDVATPMAPDRRFIDDCPVEAGIGEAVECHVAAVDCSAFCDGAPDTYGDCHSACEGDLEDCFGDVLEGNCAR